MKPGVALEYFADLVAERVARRLGDRTVAKGQDSDHTARLLTVEQAASYLGRSKAGVQHLIADGALPVVRFDRRVFLDLRDLNQWIDMHKR